MNIFEAVLICEGVDEPWLEERRREAWQMLIDTGTVYKLQGCLGRTAKSLNEYDICHLRRRRPMNKPKNCGSCRHFHNKLHTCCV